MKTPRIEISIENGELTVVHVTKQDSHLNLTVPIDKDELFQDGADAVPGKIGALVVAILGRWHPEYFIDSQ